jgi:uncharacterized protein YeaO (DUF488 family)
MHTIPAMRNGAGGKTCALPQVCTLDRDGSGQEVGGMPAVRIRRIYEDPSPADGRRILVDRLWPRGLAKSAAAIDEWAKAVAPSDELRRWYGHEPGKFAEFQRRYQDELQEPERAQALQHLSELAKSGTITLLTATRDVEHSQAAALAHRLAADPATRCEEEERGGDPPCWLHRVCPQCGAIASTDPPTTCPQCRADMPGV